MSSYLVEILKMDVEMTWACKCVVFSEDYVELEGNKPSWLKPFWRPHRYGGGNIRPVNRGLLQVDVVVCCIDKPFLPLISCLPLCMK